VIRIRWILCSVKRTERSFRAGGSETLPYGKTYITHKGFGVVLLRSGELIAPPGGLHKGPSNGAGQERLISLCFFPSVKMWGMYRLHGEGRKCAKCVSPKTYA
jgi:hypothetical protein